MAISETEITRVHERLDNVMAIVGDIKVSVARIEERLPNQPCEALTGHLEAHKINSAKTWEVAMKFLNPAALGAAIWALIKTYSETK